MRLLRKGPKAELPLEERTAASNWHLQLALLVRTSLTIHGSLPFTFTFVLQKPFLYYISMPGPLPPPPPSWMLTHRYTRRHLAHHNTADPYNTLLTAHDSKNHEKSNTTTPSLEYWTNGTTTHLVTVPVEPPTSSFLYQSQQASPTQTVPQRQQQEKPSRTNRVVRNSLIAGSFSGMASTITLYPLDVLRTKLQAAAAASGNQHTTHHSGTSALRTVWHETWRLGGWRALYTGLSLPLAAQVVYKSSIFTIVNVTQSWLLDWKRLEREKLGLSHTATTLTYADTAVTGFTAGAINGACFVTPVELVRNQVGTIHTAARL